MFFVALVRFLETDLQTYIWINFMKQSLGDLVFHWIGLNIHCFHDTILLGSKAFRTQYPGSFCGIPVDMPWFAGQCGTMWKTWVNLWPHGFTETRKLCPTIQRPNKMCSRFLCNKFAHSCRRSASSKSKPTKYIPRPPMIWVFFWVIHQYFVFADLFQCPQIPSNNIARMNGGIKPNMPTMQAACPQTRICRPISNQCLMTGEFKTVIQ